MPRPRCRDPRSPPHEVRRTTRPGERGSALTRAAELHAVHARASGGRGSRPVGLAARRAPAQRSRAPAARRRPQSPTYPRCQLLAEDLRLVALSSTTRTRAVPAGACSAVGAGRRLSMHLETDGEPERAALARLTLTPMCHPSAPPGAWRSPGRGPCRRTCAWSRSACENGWKRPLHPRARCRCPVSTTSKRTSAASAAMLLERSTLHDHLALLGELDRVADQVHAGPDAAPGSPRAGGHVGSDSAGSSRPLPGLLRQQRDDVLHRLSQVELDESRARACPASILEKSRMSLMIDSSALAGTPDRFGVFPLLGVELGVQQQPGHADHPVHGRTDLVAHRGQELGLGHRGLERHIPCLLRSLEALPLFLRLLALGDVLTHPNDGLRSAFSVAH